MFLTKTRFLGFLILLISLKSNVSFSSISLLIDQLFKVGVPPFTYNEASKNMVPASITLRFLFHVSIINIYKQKVKVINLCI